MEVTDTERAVLRIVQRDIPDSLTPFADIAAKTGLREEEVIAFLQSLKECGAIRRFGASVKHQKAGFTHNVMVAWRINPEHVDEAGKAAAENRNVSHCYYRPSPAPDWPYTLYTMIHGRTKEECEAVINELRAIPRLTEYAALSSLKELKKISMTYF